MGVSRRALLGGGAAVAAVATTGVLVEYDVLPGRSRARSLLGLTGPDGTIPDVATGPVERGALPSSRVSVPPPWAIAYPPGVAAGARLPVVVVLHYAGSSVDGIFASLGLAEFLADSGAQLALAAVDGSGRSYWQAHGDEDTGAMVLEEFLPMLAERGLDVGAPGWLGWSMGGYGALRLSAIRQRSGLDNGPVVAVSPAVWPEFSETAPGAFQDAAQYLAGMELISAEPRPETRIDCGTADPFYRNLVDFVEGKELEVHFEAGDHTKGYWTRELPSQLDWLAYRLEA